LNFAKQGKEQQGGKKTKGEGIKNEAVCALRRKECPRDEKRLP
jgi:hypothetical protein